MKNLLLLLRIFFPSFLTVLLFKILKFKVGKNVKIAPLSYIKAEYLEFGDDSTVRPFTWIKCKKFIIGRSTTISYGVQIKGAGSFITGDNCLISIYTLIHCDEDVIIGYYSSLGVRNNVYTHSSFLPSIYGYPVKFKKIIIGDFVFIGMNVSLLPGTQIGNNCIISPGLVIGSVIKPDTLVTVTNKYTEKIRLGLSTTDINTIRLEKIEALVEDFLENFGIDYTKSESRYIFKIKHKGYFFDTSQQNVIKLCYGKHTIIYRLDKFEADFSDNKIHTSFIKHIRRRHGIRFTYRHDPEL